MIANNHKYNKPNNQSKHLFKNLLSINFDSKTQFDSKVSLCATTKLVTRCSLPL